MPLRLIPLLLLVFALPAHAQEPVPRTTWPQWLAVKIKRYEAMDANTAPLEIWQLTHKGQPAYYVVSPCCDQYNPLLSAKGRVLCHPSGGIHGQGDSRCPAPADPNTLIRFVWAHPKSAPQEHVPPQLGAKSESTAEHLITTATKVTAALPLSPTMHIDDLPTPPQTAVSFKRPSGAKRA